AISAFARATVAHGGSRRRPRRNLSRSATGSGRTEAFSPGTAGGPPSSTRGPPRAPSPASQHLSPNLSTGRGGENWDVDAADSPLTCERLAELLEIDGHPPDSYRIGCHGNEFDQAFIFDRSSTRWVCITPSAARWPTFACICPRTPRAVIFCPGLMTKGTKVSDAIWTSSGLLWRQPFRR